MGDRGLSAAGGAGDDEDVAEGFGGAEGSVEGGGGGEGGGFVFSEHCECCLFGYG